MVAESTDAKKVFRPSTMNRVASSDELDHYIKVTNPSAWVVLIAALMLVGGIAVWALVAVIPVTLETTGITYEANESNKATVVCCVDKTTANRIRETGMRAYIDGVEAKSATLDSMPMSATEVLSLFGSDFVAESIELGDWNYRIIIEPGGELNYSSFTLETTAGSAHLVPVSIVTSETQPINILLGKNS